MEENKLARKIKKAASVHLLLSLPLLVLAALFIVLFASSGMLSADGYFTPQTIQSMSAIDEIAKRPLTEAYNISLVPTMDNIIDTGIYRKEDDTTVGDYLAVYMDGKYIFCYINDAKYNAITGDESALTFTGTLQEVKSETVDLAIQQMAKENINESDARDMIYGYYVDTTDNGAFLRTFLYLLTLALLFFGLLILIRSLLTLANPKNYSQVKKLAKYGEVEYLYEELEREYGEKAGEAMPLGMGRGSIILGERWIIIVGALWLKFMKADSLLWAYKQKHTTKAYGVITTNVSFILMLRGMKKTLSVFGKEFNVDSVLTAVASKYPWAVLGYSANLEAAWKSNRDQFTDYAREKGASNPM
jgi:hypothetical protein